MFCSNCGNRLNGNEVFCSNCGNNVSNITKQNVVQKNKEKKIKKFFNKYKKIFLIGFVILGGLIICLILFFILFGFDKLQWDRKYTDYELEYISPTNIKLGVIFENEQKIKDIKFNVNCGKVKFDGLEVYWDLTDATGKCKITASYKLRKISKKFNVIDFDTKKTDLALEYEIDMDSDEDLDLDGLTNKQEKEYKTNALLSDTDMDGLDDNYEILTIKTDPIKNDTDGDGLTDYDELKLGLDPLKKDSKGDGVLDGKRSLTYDFTSDNVKVSITGTGNIASTVAHVNSNTKISNKVGLIDNLYNFYTDGTIEKAIITIPYTDDQLVKYGLNENNLSIYYYDEKNSKYEKIETIIDKENNTLTATLNHFSSYVVGDSSLVKETSTTQVLFILDNSWSMYTNEQYKEITGDKASRTDLDGFDAEGIRFSLTSNLITRLSKKNYQIGLSEFRSDYANALEIGSDVESLKSKLAVMNGDFITRNAGTDISNALNKGFSEFSKDVDNKYIVILTDGQDSTLKKNTKKLIQNAIKKDVKICSIGFGDGSYNVELSNISNSTGCKFFSSSNADGLTELFENIGSELDDDLVDIDGDSVADGILVADSGFVVNRDGFSFSNYGTNLSLAGHCYGMATFAQLYYKKQLPFTVASKKAGGEESYAYDLTDTYFEDYNNLYDYKLQTNSLKYTFGFNLFDEEIYPNTYTVGDDLQARSLPADFRRLNGKLFEINKKYRKEIVESEMYDILEGTTSLTKAEQIRRWGVYFERAEVTQLNENKMQSSSINNDDKQMFNAIYAGFIRQFETTHYSSGMDFMLWARNAVGSESTDYSGSEGFINILKTRLNDRDVPVISSDYSGGLHAVNAISLVQDIENPNYYYIGVYDNNYPGEKRYVDIKCKEDICTTVANKYYTKSGQPIRITPSLEYDLEYYN